MAHAIRRVVRGPSTKVNAYAGPAGELVMDTTTNDLVLETGMAGGVRMAKASTAISATNGVEVTVGGTLGEATTISGVDATTSVKGVVQLSGATNGTSQTKAATEKAVADALQAAKDYADAHSGGSYTGASPIVVSGTTISVSDATTGAKGAVQLSNATNSSSQTQAATPKAVSDALAEAKSYTDSHSGGTYTGVTPISVSGTSISVANATTSSRGVVQVGSNIGVSSGVISVASASTSAAGVAQLSNATNSTSQTQAATPNAVYNALVEAKAYADNTNAHASKPAVSRTVAMTLPSSGGTVTMPGDGYLTMKIVATTASGESPSHITKLFNGSIGMTDSNTGTTNAQGRAVTIPVSKNDVVTVYYSSIRLSPTWTLTFTYANGAA